MRNYDTDIYKKYRDDYINNIFLPIAKAMFKSHRQINSLVMCIAQYFNDEADDAVHVKLIPASFKSSFKHWQDLFDSRKNTVISHFKLDITKYCISNDDDFFEKYELPFLDNTEKMINAFGPFCKKGFTNCHDHIDSYSPYALAIRDKNYTNGIKIKTFDKFLLYM
jgi:hypothetical protein